MDDYLMTPPIFLSASEPNPERDGKFWQGRNLLNIREAVRTFCAHILTHYPLVYGGHPAITPLVNQVAARVADQSALEAEQQRKPPPSPPTILMFQSSLYLDPLLTRNEPFIPREGVVVTPAHEADGRIAKPPGGRRNASLLRMRYEMLGGPGNYPVHHGLSNFAQEFGELRAKIMGTHEFSAAVFIGGMEGVEREFNIFRSFHPTVPAYPIGSTGSACMELLMRGVPHLGPELFDLLRTEPAYSLLMQKILPIPESSLRSETPRAPWPEDPDARDPSSHIDPDRIDGPRPPR
jgi:SLOG-like protein